MTLKVVAVEERIERGGSEAETSYLDTAPKEFDGVRDTGSWLHKEGYKPDGANYYCKEPKETKSGGSVRRCVIIEGMDESTYLNLHEYVEAKYAGVSPESPPSKTRYLDLLNYRGGSSSKD